MQLPLWAYYIQHSAIRTLQFIMSDEGGVVQEMQEEEILALQSIYSEEEYLKLNNAEAAALLTGFGADTEAVTVDPSAEKVQDGSGKGVSGDFSSHLKLDSDFSVIGKVSINS